jgi:hypothetical protein
VNGISPQQLLCIPNQNCTEATSIQQIGKHGKCKKINVEQNVQQINNVLIVFQSPSPTTENPWMVFWGI